MVGALVYGSARPRSLLEISNFFFGGPDTGCSRDSIKTHTRTRGFLGVYVMHAIIYILIAQ